MDAYKSRLALIKKNEKTVYFVAEAKSAGQELKTSEKRKIMCGRAHFNEFENAEYRQVSTCENWIKSRFAHRVRQR